MMAVFALALALLPAPQAEAAPPPRSLGGRRFLLPARVPHPFIVNAFTFRLGAASLFLPNAPTGLGDGRSDLRLVAAVERFGLALRLHDRVGINGMVSGQVATGIDPTSALYGGARAGLEWESGATVRLLLRDRFQLSLLPGLYGSMGTNIEPVEVVAAALDLIADPNQAEDRPKHEVEGLFDGLVTPTRTFGGGIALSGAWQLKPRLGLVAGLRGRGGTAATQSERGLPISWSGGLALDARLHETSPVIGQLEYRYRGIIDAASPQGVPLEDRSESQHFLGGGIWWRSSHEAELGVDSWTLLRRTKNDERLVAFEAVVRVFL